MSEQQLQVWVRNDKGQVYGPLSPPSVELLIDNGIIGGRLQVSTNGENYVFPGRVPGLRMIFPRETWGEQIVPGDQLDAEWSKVVAPAGLPTVGTAPASGPSGAAPPPASGPSGIAPGPPPGARGPAAGPGVRAGPGAAPGGPVAGPGAVARPAGNRPAHVARPMGVGPGGAGPGGAMPGPPVMVSSGSGIAQPPVKSSPSVMDFMNNATGRPAAPPPPAAVPRSSPSVAEIMNSPAPAAPVAARPSGPVPGPPPAARASQPSAVRTSAPQNLQSMEELGMPPTGTIGAPAPTHLYYIAAAKELTGLLTLTLPDREVQVHFRKGNPEFLDSTHPEDSLDTFLLSQRLANQDQINQAQSQLARFGGDLLPALFGLGLLNPNAVFQHLGQRATQLLVRALTAEQGTFAFDLEDLAPSRAMPLGNKWSIYLDALRKVSAPDIRRRQMGALELPVMKASGRIPVSDVRLTPQETRAYNHFDGARSLSQLARDFPQEADVLMRVAWMLLPLELVSFAGLSQAAQARAAAAPPRGAVPGPPPAAVARPAQPAAAPQRPPPPVMAPPAGAAPAKPAGAAPGNPVSVPKPAGVAYPSNAARTGDAPSASSAPQRPPPPVMKPAEPAKPAAPKVTAAPPATSADDIKQLQQLYETMKKADYFAVLNLKRESDANQVKIAYLKAARSYHPDTIPPGAPPELAKVKADLFALIGEANRTLSDQVLRADYIAELDAGGTGSKVDVEKLLKGEELFQKGRVYIQARKYADGFKLFEEAIACNADEPEFYAWRGYSRFLAASDKKLVTHEATKDIKACIEKNPNVATAHYFMGYIIKTNGDAKAALPHFKKCVALDPKHIDAAREVRTAAGK
ncbi:MAG: DnaJ domain-containing protein [Archangium sp.]|nr:DnaJ domain-containing protein [Archangium sp.]